MKGLVILTSLIFSTASFSSVLSECSAYAQNYAKLSLNYAAANASRPVSLMNYTYLSDSEVEVTYVAPNGPLDHSGNPDYDRVTFVVSLDENNECTVE